MGEWMDLEISFWFLVAIGLGLVLLVGRKVRNEEYFLYVVKGTLAHYYSSIYFEY